MNWHSDTAQALWDARDELEDYEQHTHEDGFTIHLAGGHIHVFEFPGRRIAMTARLDGRDDPLNYTAVYVYDALAASSAIEAVVRSDAARILLAHAIATTRNPQ